MINKMWGRELFVCLLLWCGLAGADDYSDALDAEAGEITVDKQTSEETHKEGNIPLSEWSGRDQSLLDGLPAGLSQRAFSQALKKIYFGSYIFYKNLSYAQKQSIYLAYKRNNDIDEIRSLIIKYYKHNL